MTRFVPSAFSKIRVRDRYSITYRQNVIKFYTNRSPKPGCILRRLHCAMDGAPVTENAQRYRISFNTSVYVAYVRE